MRDDVTYKKTFCVIFITNVELSFVLTKIQKKAPFYNKPLMANIYGKDKKSFYKKINSVELSGIDKTS